MYPINRGQVDGSLRHPALSKTSSGLVVRTRAVPLQPNVRSNLNKALSRTPQYDWNSCGSPQGDLRISPVPPDKMQRAHARWTSEAPRIIPAFASNSMNFFTQYFTPFYQASAQHCLRECNSIADGVDVATSVSVQVQAEIGLTDRTMRQSVDRSPFCDRAAARNGQGW